MPGMAARTLERDPTNLAAQEEQRKERERQSLAVALNRRAHLTWLLEEPMGRRELRRQLSDASLDVACASVSDVTDRHHGQMCANVALRYRGEQLLWSILRLVTREERLLRPFCKLFTETDE